LLPCSVHLLGASVFCCLMPLDCVIVSRRFETSAASKRQ